MRAVAALLVIQDSDKNPQLTEFVLHIRSSPDLQVFNSGKHNIFFLLTTFVFLQALLDSIQKDSLDHDNLDGTSSDQNMDLS